MDSRRQEIQTECIDDKASNQEAAWLLVIGGY